jgi:hypothetical protein
MRDILYSFFKSNQNASDDILHRTFLLGTQSWGKQLLYTTLQLITGFYKFYLVIYSKIDDIRVA